MDKSSLCTAGRSNSLLTKSYARLASSSWPADKKALPLAFRPSAASRAAANSAPVVHIIEK